MVKPSRYVTPPGYSREGTRVFSGKGTFRRPCPPKRKPIRSSACGRPSLEVSRYTKWPTVALSHDAAPEKSPFLAPGCRLRPHACRSGAEASHERIRYQVTHLPRPHSSAIADTTLPHALTLSLLGYSSKNWWHPVWPAQHVASRRYRARPCHRPPPRRHARALSAPRSRFPLAAERPLYSELVNTRHGLWQRWRGRRRRWRWR